MKRILVVTLLITAMPVFAAKPAWVENKHGGHNAEEHGQEKHGHQGYDERDHKEDRQGDYRESDRYGRLSHTERERLLNRVLVDHYGARYLPAQHRYQQLPPGLRKKLQRGGDLPPGWKSKLVPGQRLDADLYRHAERLPSDLLNAITGRNDGIELLRIGDRIVRVAQGRGTILDVIDLSDRALGLFN